MAKSSTPLRPEDDPMAWRQMARDDLFAAETLAEALKEKPSLAWEVGFHGQQAIEKFLKALLVAVNVIPSRTHDIAYLLDECLQHCTELEPYSEELPWLTQFASEVRYPGGFDVTPEEAQKVLELANKVKDVVEQWFESREGG